jgi:hypothetical protein
MTTNTSILSRLRHPAVLAARHLAGTGIQHLRNLLLHFVPRPGNDDDLRDRRLQSPRRERMTQEKQAAMFAELERYYESIRDNPAELEKERNERRIWDRAIKDGLGQAEPYKIEPRSRSTDNHND